MRLAAESWGCLWRARKIHNAQWEGIKCVNTAHPLPVQNATETWSFVTCQVLLYSSILVRCRRFSPAVIKQRRKQRARIICLFKTGGTCCGHLPCPTSTSVINKTETDRHNLRSMEALEAKSMLNYILYSYVSLRWKTILMTLKRFSGRLTTGC